MGQRYRMNSMFIVKSNSVEMTNNNNTYTFDDCESILLSDNVVLEWNFGTVHTYR